MARIRSVKPELRRDLTVAEWPRECRYAWVLLWGYLDDYGRGLDDLRLLVADLFPLDRDVSERKLDGWLRLMCAHSTHGEPPLCRYEVGGRRFLHAPKWHRSQRVSHPQATRIPPCPLHDGSGIVPESFANDDGVTPEPFQTSRAPEDLGSKGAREQGAVPAKTERDLAFEEFWLVYPRKIGKGQARKAWDRATKTTDVEIIMAGAVRYARSAPREEQFIPHPTTWLNGLRWLDVVTTSNASDPQYAWDV